MSVFLAKSSEKKTSKDILSATSAMPAWMKGGNVSSVNNTKINNDIQDLIDEAETMNKIKSGQAGGKKKSKKASKKSSKKASKPAPKSAKKSSKKASKKTSKKASKKTSKKASKKQSGAGLPAKLVQYRATVKKVQAEIEKVGIKLKGITSINKYVGEYNKAAKAAGTDAETYIMKKVLEDVKDVSKLKKKFEDIEKQSIANRAAKKAAKKAASSSSMSDSS